METSEQRHKRQMQEGNQSGLKSRLSRKSNHQSQGEADSDAQRLRIGSEVTDASPEQVAERTPQESSNFSVLVSRPKFMASQRRVVILRDEESNQLGAKANNPSGSGRMISADNQILGTPMATTTPQATVQSLNLANFSSYQSPGFSGPFDSPAIKSENVLGDHAAIGRKHAPRLSLNGFKGNNTPLPCPIMKNKPVMVYMPKKELEIWKIKPLKKGSSIGDRGSKIVLPSSNINVDSKLAINPLGPVPIGKKPSFPEHKPPAGGYPRLPQSQQQQSTGLKSVPPRRPDLPPKEKLGHDLSVIPTTIKPASSPDLMDPKSSKSGGMFKLHPVPANEKVQGPLPSAMISSDPSQNKQPVLPKPAVPQKSTSIGRAVSSQELPVEGSRRRKEQVKGWESPVEKYSFPPKIPKKQSGTSTATGGSGANPHAADAVLADLGVNEKTSKS